MAELRRRMKLAEYITALYEFHFPWLADFRDVEAELDYATSAEGDEGIQLNALKSVPNPVVEDRVLPRRAGGAPR